MATSADLGLPYIASSQAQPEVTHNDALNLLQAMLNGVIDRGVNTPAVSPTIGDSYIIGSSPTGVWAGRANCVTIWNGTAWDFIPGENSAGTPITMGARQEGMRIWVRDEDLVYVWDGSAWTSQPITVADNSVTNAKLADMATQTIKGRTTAGTGDPEDLTATQARTVLGLATTDSPTFTALTLTNGQIVFPATQVASAGANTLDDYEEGTWTPTLTFATPGDLAYTTDVLNGTYTKLGNIARIGFAIRTTSFTHTTASGDMKLSGTPFDPSGGTSARGYGPLEWRGITKTPAFDLSAATLDAGNAIRLVACSSGAVPSVIGAADMPSGGTVLFIGSVTLQTV